jgi:transcriptional regulator with XRE-family HTH domain
MPNWIKQRRKELNISQEELSARLQIMGFDIARATVSHWEMGKHYPPIHDMDFAIALSKALEITTYDLLQRAGYITSEFGENAGRAAAIIDALPPDQQDFALVMLEQLLKRQLD